MRQMKVLKDWMKLIMYLPHLLTGYTLIVLLILSYTLGYLVHTLTYRTLPNLDMEMTLLVPYRGLSLFLLH